MPTVRAPSPTGVDIRRQPSAPERWPALCSPRWPGHAEHGLPSQRAFFAEITVTCHLPTGRSQARFIPLQLGHRRGDLGAPLWPPRGSPCLFLSSFDHGDRCPVMPARFYLITFFLRPDTETQTLQKEQLTCNSSEFRESPLLCSALRRACSQKPAFHRSLTPLPASLSHPPIGLTWLKGEGQRRQRAGARPDTFPGLP